MAFWLPAAIIGSAVLGAGASARAGSKAAKATGQAADAATAEQRRQFDLSRQDMAPWMQSGRQALDMRSRLLGLGGSGGSGGGQQGGYAQGSPDWNAYLQANPDVAQHLNSNPRLLQQAGGLGQAAEQHYNAFGRAEGRQLPMAGGQGQPGQTGSAGGLVDRGDGTMMQGGGGEGQLTAGGDPNDPYNAFLNSGHARSMLETNQSDMERMTGAMGAGGKSMSGSHIKALNDINRRNTSNAFSNFDNALAGVSNTGQVTAANMGQMGMNMANNIGNMQMNAAGQRGSSYMNTANAVNSGLQNATNVFAYGKGQGWF